MSDEPHCTQDASTELTLDYVPTALTTVAALIADGFLIHHAVTESSTSSSGEGDYGDPEWLAVALVSVNIAAVVYWVGLVRAHRATSACERAWERHAQWRANQRSPAEACLHKRRRILALAAETSDDEEKARILSSLPDCASLRRNVNPPP